MGNTGIPVADSFWYLVKLIQFVKFKKKNKDQLLHNKDLDVLCKSGLSIVLSLYNVLSPFFFLLHSADALLTFTSEQLASPIKTGPMLGQKGVNKST